MVWASLATGDDQQALDSLEKVTEPRYGLMGAVLFFKFNAWNDPISNLFIVKLRYRLGS